MTKRNGKWQTSWPRHIHFPDGRKYVGEWKDGDQHGQGTFTAFGETYVGEFKDDQFID